MDTNLIIDFGPIEEQPEYYEFTSKLTGEKKKIKILPEDIIVDGELRRPIRDTTGEIPDWAKPKITGHGYIRITPDGKVYGKTGKEIKTKRTSTKHVICGLNSQGIQCSISLLICIHTSFNFENYKKTGSAYNLFNIEKGLDITTLRTEFSPEFYGTADINKSDLKEDYDEVTEYRNILNKIIYRCKYRSAYKNVTINDDMKNIAVGAKWYSEGRSYRLKSGATLEIDKDVADKNEYSLKYCIIAPKYINTYFIRAKGTSTGVSKRKWGYASRVNDFLTCNRIHLGTFRTEKEAHQAWADSKNKQLQEVVIPYFINDVFEEDRNHPMVLKIIQALRNYKFI